MPLTTPRPQHSVLSLPSELGALLPRCYERVVAATLDYAVGLHRTKPRGPASRPPGRPMCHETLYKVKNSITSRE